MADQESRHFRDKEGSNFVFHGHNVVVKIPPYLPTFQEENKKENISEMIIDPQWSLNDRDIANLVDWGVNIVRLGLIWEAVEKEKGVYDFEYLAQAKDLIDRLGAHGIYSIVDSHQDMFSRVLCGEGIPWFYSPTWDQLDHECPSSLMGGFMSFMGECKSMNDYNIPRDENGWFIPKECNKANFLKLYATVEVSSAFESFWQNTLGAQEAFFAYWKTLGNYFQDNEHVIGYDLLNEPFTANFIKDSSLFIDTKKFDREYLHPFYSKTADAIRDGGDTKHLIFFEPNQVPNVIPLMGGIINQAGFPTVPGSEMDKRRMVLDEHLYCCGVDIAICETGEPPMDKMPACRDFHQRKMNARKEDANRLQVPIMISEFGACDGASESCINELMNVGDACDEHVASWAYWMLKGFGDFTTISDDVQGIYDDKGEIQKQKLAALTRTYIRRYQGVPQKVRFDLKTGDFASWFEYNPEIKDKSILYVNEDEFYPNGFTLTASFKSHGGHNIRQISVQSTKIRKNYYELHMDRELKVKKQIALALTPLNTKKEGKIDHKFFKAEYQITAAQKELMLSDVFVHFPESSRASGNVWIEIRDLYNKVLWSTNKHGLEYECSSADYVYTKFVVVQSAYMGLSSTDVGEFTIPSLNGHRLMINQFVFYEKGQNNVKPDF